MYKILVIVGLLIVSHGLTGLFSYKAGGDSQRAASAAKVIEAVDAARKKEQADQEKVNEQAQKQINDLSDINSTLNANLDRVRNRPDRRHMPDKPEVSCKGATGKDLSAQDSGFLTREAARADTIRAALKTCYNYANTVSQ